MREIARATLGALLIGSLFAGCRSAPETASAPASDDAAMLAHADHAALARTRTVPENVLWILARENRVDVRAGVAGNPAAPANMLRVLARDESAEVRRATAGNPETPASVLLILAADADPDVRLEVAENPSLRALRKFLQDMEIQDNLRSAAASPAKRARWLAADSPKTPPYVLAALAKDEDAEVRWRVARNSFTPPDALAGLASDADPDVRALVASNSNSPEAALRLLADDKEPAVSQAAKAAMARRGMPPRR